MRTTIRLDDKLFSEVELYAARRGKSLSSVVEDALRETLAKQHSLEIHPPVELTTVPGNGLQPGVNLNDSAALLELMKTNEVRGQN